MAHHRWTLALILICIPILATVISAFRVRDLPKTLQDIHKTDIKKQKCDDCDVNGLKSNKLHSDKIESVKRYDELKKATREKLQSVSQKASETKSTIRLKNKSDEENNDEVEKSTRFLNSDTILKSKVHPTVNVGDKSTSRLKLEVKTKNLASNEDEDSDYESNDDDNDSNKDDNDDDDDGDDDDDDDTGIKISIGSKIKLGSVNKIDKSTKPIDKKPPATKTPLKPVLVTKISINDDDDDDDDDDDEDYANKKVQVEKTSVKQEKQTTSKEDFKKSYGSQSAGKVLVEKTKGMMQSSSNNDNDDEGDDNEDDNDDNDGGYSIFKFIKEKMSVISTETIKQSLSVKHGISGISADDDDDDDDNDDDDNDDGHVKHKQQIEPLKKSSKVEDKFISKDKQNDPTPKKSKEKRELPHDNAKKRDTEQIKDTKVAKKPDVAKKDSIIESKQKAEDLEIKKTIYRNKPDALPKKDDKKTIKVTEEQHKEPLKKEEHKSKPVEKKETKRPDEDKKMEHKSDLHLKKTEEKSIKLKVDSKLGTEHKKQPEKEHDKTDKSSKEILFDSRETLAKSESNLKHVTDALHRRNLLQSEFEDFYAFFPTFAPNFSRIHNPECRRHGQIVLRQLRGTKLWAFNMLDATAKIPSGLLQGNGIQLGDYDQCLSSRARVQLESGSVVKVQGQYCLAGLDLKAEHPDLELPVHLALAKNLIKSRIDDPGHFVPRFSTLSWGVCVPTACAPEDVEVVLKDALKHYQHTSGLVVRVKVDPRDCHTHDPDWWDQWFELPTILTLSLYGIVILVVLAATLQDFFARRRSEKTEDSETDEQAECDQKETKDEEEAVDVPAEKDSVFKAFSLYQSVDKLVAPCSDDEVACIHGIRGLATLALLVAHKFLPVAVLPYTNRLQITNTISSPLWSWCRAGWVFTDCFLLLSGTLTAHRSGGDTSVPWKLFQRYLRLTPALLAIVLFYAYVWDNTSEGPMWGTLVTKNAELCQEGWWWNLLYVQNFFGFEEMCAPQTHQLALDMQLTIIGSAIVWAIQSEIPFSKYAVPAIMGIATYSRYSTVQEHRLTMLAYHGVSVSQLYRTARLSYTSTLHRSTPYLIGLSLGMMLRNPRQHGKIVLSIGWLISLTLWSLVWWAGLDAGSTQYRYSASFAAQYASLAPIASAVAIAWVVYTVHRGQCEWLSNLLSCRFLAFISRLSYALYLSQFIVFLTSAATVRTSTEFTLISLVDVHEISAILLLSVVLTLTFVIPMQSFHKIFSSSSKSEKTPSEEKEALDEQEKQMEETESPADNINEDEEYKVEPQIRSRQNFMAHREVLEEIPEIEIEYEIQRERNEGLEEILEEEEDEEPDERADDDDLEIIEEEQGGEEDLWEERDAHLHRRPYSRADDDDQDLDEWEWTTNGNGRYGAQYYRYSR